MLSRRNSKFVRALPPRLCPGRRVRPVMAAFAPGNAVARVIDDIADIWLDGWVFAVDSSPEGVLYTVDFEDGGVEEGVVGDELKRRSAPDRQQAPQASEQPAQATTPAPKAMSGKVPSAGSSATPPDSVSPGSTCAEVDKDAPVEKQLGALTPGDGIPASAVTVNQAFVDAGCTWKSVAKMASKDRAQFINTALNKQLESRSGRGARDDAGITTAGTLTYGEVPAEEALRVLRVAEPRPGETFVDIGSGRGQIVIGMCLEWAGVLKECVGIEALPNLVELAKDVGERVVTQAATDERGGSRRGDGAAPDPGAEIWRKAPTTHLRFSCADFLKQDVSWLEADVIWMTGTCFPDSWMSAKGVLGRLFSKLKAGTRLCITTHRLNIPRLRCVDVISDLRPSWGHDTANIYLVEDESDEEDE